MNKLIAIPLAVILTIVSAMSISNEFFIYIVIMMCYWAIVALSLNVVVGYTGMISLGIVGLMGVGAYVSAIFTLNYNMSFWIALPLAGVITALFGILLGLIASKTRGMHFAIITLMIGIALYTIFCSWKEVTGGLAGLGGIPTPDPINLYFFTIDFSSPQVWYFFVLAFTLLTIFFLYKLVDSRIGKIFVSIRDDEGLATMMGVDERTYKILSWVICCFFVGIAGSLYAHYITYISPAAFEPWASFEILIYVIFGGPGTILGPIIGTVLLRSMFEIFHLFAEYRLIVCGILVLLIVRYMPQGLYGSIKEKIREYKIKGH